MREVLNRFVVLLAEIIQSGRQCL